MKILAIETSCDETAAAVVENGRTVLSSVVLSQIEEHKLYGGVVPEIASRRHIENISSVVQSALDEAELSTDHIDAIGVTAGPGLIGALLVGVNFGKAMAFSLGVPLIPVHHIRGHVAANYLTYPELKPPFICLIASGGHSHIVEVSDYSSYRIMGRTLDDAAGEAFDKVARTIGLPYPGGVHIDIQSKLGNKNAYPLPTPKTEGEYNFSFSGIKTAVINLVHNLEQKGETLVVADLAASFQSKVVDILSGKLFRAAQDSQYTTVVCAGGVAANSELRQRLEQLATEKGFRLFIPPLSLCGDNAAMIGSQAYYDYLNGDTTNTALNAYATCSIEQPPWLLSP